jgi:hypothetical protein
LIRELSLTCGGNVRTKKVVECTCSGTGYGEWSRVVDCNQSNYWHSLDSPNSWIQFDFKTRKVSLTHYSLKSSGNSLQFLQQWEIRGSNDAKTWDLLDSRSTHELDGTYITKTFACSVESSTRRPYRYLRLTQTGKNGSGQNYLVLSRIEFFGSLITPSVASLPP